MWTNTYTTWKAVPEFPRIFPERDDSEVQARANGRRDVESEAKTLWWSLKISKFTFGGSTLPKTTSCAPYVARDFSIFLDMFRVSSRWCVCSCRDALEKSDSFCHHLPCSISFICFHLSMSSPCLERLYSDLDRYFELWGKPTKLIDVSWHHQVAWSLLCVTCVTLYYVSLRPTRVFHSVLICAESRESAESTANISWNKA